MKFSQLPHTLLMIRPSSFGFNTETYLSNQFQQLPEAVGDLQSLALEEFDRMVALLQSHDINVRVFDDTGTSAPDAIFPNNWISFHEDGTVVLYPMMAVNRRKERRADIIQDLSKDFFAKEIIDFSGEEFRGQFLEGTGSLVFDHPNRIAYASRSPRTSEALVKTVASRLGYEPVLFSSADEGGRPVFHTNVVMGVGARFAVICLDAIGDESDHEKILDRFMNTGHKVIAISFAQMRAFAGNILEISNKDGEPIVLMSATAFHSLLPGQLDAIGRFAEILPVEIPNIEKYGGGSVRCMVAGIHLPTLK
jgi:hypothetical protein